MSKFFKSFRYAAIGVRYALKGRNFRFHLCVAALVLVASAYLRISREDLALVALTIGFVLSMEATNTAVEEICNKFHPESHPHIALIKDLAAGAVLISALTSLAVGAIVFLPYLSLPR